MSPDFRHRTDKSAPSLCKQNAKKDWLARITELYKFLKGEVPEGVTVPGWKGMSSKRAFTLIWFLQENTEVLPDNYEACAECDEIFDSYAGGEYDENTGKHYCDTCRGD